MDNERLTWNEICEKYPNQWVGMKDVVYLDGLYGNVDTAIVIVSNGNKQELRNRMLDDKNFLARHTDPDRLMRGINFTIF